jgi:hypothetical protein
MATSGALEREALSTGTSRQPIRVWPSSAITSATTRSMAVRRPKSFGMKMWLTA